MESVTFCEWVINHFIDLSFEKGIIYYTIYINIGQVKIESGLFSCNKVGTDRVSDLSP